MVDPANVIKMLFPSSPAETLGSSKRKRFPIVCFEPPPRVVISGLASLASNTHSTYVLENVFDHLSKERGTNIGPLLPSHRSAVVKAGPPCVNWLNSRKRRRANPPAYVGVFCSNRLSPMAPLSVVSMF